ncbi:MAG: hypothetical protein Fur0041_16060 [Bacteroidia bacterium]
MHALCAQDITKKNIFGKVTVYDANGKKVSEGRMKRGQNVGVWKYYDTNGELMKTITFRNGVKEGLYTEYHQKEKTTGEYHNNLREGNRITYESNGIMIRQEQYLHDTLNGLLQEWKVNGQKVKEVKYDKGVVVYEAEWLASGEMKKYASYSKGRLHGQFREYDVPDLKSDTFPHLLIEYRNGLKNGIYQVRKNQLLVYDGYFKDDLKNGRFVIRDENGQLKSEEHYIDNVYDGVCRYYHQGIIYREVMFHNGRLHGTLTEYDSFGMKKKVTWCTENAVDSALTYNPAGQVTSRKIYRNTPGHPDKKTAEFSIYNSRGQLMLHGFYRDQLKDSIWTTYYPDGKKNSETPYKKGAITGTFRKWHANGKLMLQVNCVNGVYVTDPVIWSPEGKLLNKNAALYRDILESNLPGDVYDDPSYYENKRRTGDETPGEYLNEAEPEMPGDE